MYLDVQRIRHGRVVPGGTAATATRPREQRGQRAGGRLVQPVGAEAGVDQRRGGGGSDVPPPPGEMRDDGAAVVGVRSAFEQAVALQPCDGVGHGRRVHLQSGSDDRQWQAAPAGERQQLQHLVARERQSVRREQFVEATQQQLVHAEHRRDGRHDLRLAEAVHAPLAPCLGDRVVTPSAHGRPQPGGTAPSVRPGCGVRAPTDRSRALSGAATARQCATTRRRSRRRHPTRGVTPCLATSSASWSSSS